MSSRLLLQIIFDHAEQNDPDRQTPVLFTQRDQFLVLVWVRWCAWKQARVSRGWLFWTSLINVTLICDITDQEPSWWRVVVLFVSLFFMVLVAQVVPREQAWVFAQRGSHLLLLFVASWVGDLDVAAFRGRFIYNLLQPGVERASQMFWRGIVVGMFFVSRVTAVLGWNLIQNLRFWFLPAWEAQLPPPLISHGTSRDGGWTWGGEIGVLPLWRTKVRTENIFQCQSSIIGLGSRVHPSSRFMPKLTLTGRI